MDRSVRALERQLAAGNPEPRTRWRRLRERAGTSTAPRFVEDYADLDAPVFGQRNPIRTADTHREVRSPVGRRRCRRAPHRKTRRRVKNALRQGGPGATPRFHPT